MTASDAFVTEAAEQAAAFAGDMVTLQSLVADPQAAVGDAIRELFRYAHNLKGMSAMEAIGPLNVLAHAAENLLDRYRAGDGRPDTDEIDLLLEAADAMSDMVDAVAAGRDAEPATDLVTRLDASAGTGSAPGVDIAAGAEIAAETDADRRALAAADLVIDVQLAADGALPGARAAVLFRQVERAGRVLVTVPERSAILAGAARSFTVGIGAAPEATLADDQRAALLDRLRAIPDVASVDVRPEVTATANPAATTTAEPGPSNDGSSPAATTVRVDVDRLDALLDIAGELVVERNRVETHAQRVHDRELNQAVASLRRSIAELQDLVQRVRMVPVEPVFSRLQRLVRDTARDLGKPVVFEVDGASTEVDRRVADEILQPLVHLLRNAIDHGIEPAADRLAAGKPERGTVRLVAEQRGDEVVFEVRDDGGGLDDRRIAAKAVAAGLIQPGRVEVLDRAEILDFIFAAGFSTSAEVTAVSGRGVGLDVVRATVNRFGGSVDVDSEPGIGTTFRVRFPLSLLVMDALLVRVATETWALPINRLLETTAVREGSVREAPGPTGFVIAHRAGLLPVIEGGRTLGAGAPVATPCFGVVVQTVGRPYLLTVDELLGHAEVVVRPVPIEIPGLEHVAGVTLLGDGAIALVLDLATIVDAVASHIPAAPVVAVSDRSSADGRHLFASGVARSIPVLDYFLRVPGASSDETLAPAVDVTSTIVDHEGAIPVAFDLGGPIDALLVFGIVATPALLAAMRVGDGDPGTAIDELGNMLGSQFVAALADEHGLAVTLSPPRRLDRTPTTIRHELERGRPDRHVWHTTLAGAAEQIDVALSLHSHP